MKKFFATLLLCFSLTIISQSALAQQEGIGIGGIINSPTGISLKGYINDKLAVDGAISFSIVENNSSFYVHSNVLYQGDSINKELNEAGSNLDIYYGAGFRMLWFDNQRDTIIGLRAPLGVTYQIGSTPTETFFELVPTVDVNPAFRFGFDGAVGFRYYLN